MNINFDFIKDDKFRNILERDYNELAICIKSNADKSVLILCGSIIEALLIEYFTTFPLESVTNQQILKKGLYDLISLAEEESLIKKSTKDLSTVIKDYRNLIHPGREVRKKQSFDSDTAQVAKSLLNIIIKEIRENYLNKIGYSAEDIVNKLENDSVSLPIFGKLLNKLHKIEKSKLFNALVEYDNIDHDPFQRRISNPIAYLTKLKPSIDSEVKVGKLKSLVKAIETGMQYEVMNYYYLLNDELNLLNKEDRELILLYVINVLTESTKEVDKMESHLGNQLFATLGNYLESEELKKEYFNLMCSIIKNCEKDNDYLFFETYEQCINSLSEEKKSLTKQYVMSNTQSYYHKRFYEGFKDGDYLPF